MNLIAKTLIPIIAITTFSSGAGHADDAVGIKTTQLRDNLYMLAGKGGNIGLFTGSDGSFMIDDQYAPLTEKILAAVKSVGGQAPKYLVNTHFHADHTGGNENLGNGGTLIMAHHRVRERLQAGSFVSAFGMKSPAANKAALPVVTFSTDIHLHINGDTVQVVHVSNGHTDGDSFVFFEKANVVHAGDLFFNGFFPFIDAPNGGTLKGVIAGADAILALTNNRSKIIPGHGPLANRADLQRFRDMLEVANSRLLALKDRGMTLQQVKAEAPLADLAADWGNGIFNVNKWLEIVYPAVL